MIENGILDRKCYLGRYNGETICQYEPEIGEQIPPCLRLTYSRCSINVLFSVKMVWSGTGWLDVIISFAILWSVYDMQEYAYL